MTRLLTSLKYTLLSKDFVVLFSVFIALTAEFWYFSWLLDFWGFWFFCASQCAADAFVCVAIFLCVPRRWRKIVVWWTWLSALFLFASVIYYRYSFDILSFKLIFAPASYNSLVFESIPGLLRRSDLIWLLFPAVPTVTLYLYRRRQPFSPVKPIVKLSVGFAALVYFIFSFSAISHFRAGWFRDIGQSATTWQVVKSNFSDGSNNVDILRTNGNVLYFFRQLSSLLRSPGINISETDRQQIEGFIGSRNRLAPTRDFSTDSINIIMIIVESLNSSAIGKTIDGRQVTPVLDSLLRLPGTISALNVSPQIAGGTSSDGQLIYNTGLLPLQSSITVNDFASNTYISLAKLFNKKTSVEIIGEESFVWNHSETTKSYGFDKLYSKYDIVGTDISRRTTDHEIFSFASEIITDLPQPFFALVTTLSSHFPYPVVPDDNPWIDGSDSNRRYLRSINYFDRSLGIFLSSLQNAGILQNSIVFIMSDHDAPLTVTNDAPPSEIAFIALNSGCTLNVNRHVGQIDIFPSMLDITAIASPWRGVGSSFISDSIATAIDRAGNIVGVNDSVIISQLRHAANISELIIRSDYFSNRPN